MTNGYRVKTDRELIAEAQTGDGRAFDLLVARHRAFVQRVAQRIVGSPEIAEEMVQEAMVQAYLSLSRLQDETRFRNWLCGIVRNLCHSHLRAQKERTVSWEALGEERDDRWLALPGPDALVEAREWRQTVWDAVNGLGAQDREAIRLFYFEQREIAEIAGLLKLSAGAVRVRLHRARKQLEEPLLTLYPGAHSSEKRRPKMITMAGKYRNEKQLAEAALAEYGIANARLVLLGLPLGGQTNTSLRVDTTDTGERFVLRFYCPDVRSRVVVASELQWLQALREAQVVVPAVVANRSGEPVTEVMAEEGSETRLCILQRWLPGRALGFGIGAKKARNLGALMARMHRQAEGWVLPEGFTRPRHDWDALSACLDPLAAGIAEGIISESALGMFTAFMEQMRERMAQLGEGREVWGLIHADLHEVNRLFYRGEPRPIDFADCGFGHYMFDIAASQMSLYPDEQRQFFEGYAAVRPLPEDYLAQVTDFKVAAIINNAYYHACISKESQQPLPAFDHLAQRIERTYLTPLADIPPSVLDEYAGRYALEPGQTQNMVHSDSHPVEIVCEGNRLLHQRLDWPRYELFPATENRFFLRDPAFQLAFNRDANGRVTSFTQPGGGNGTWIYRTFA